MNTLNLPLTLYDFKEQFQPPYDLAGKLVDYPVPTDSHQTVSNCPIQLEDFHAACEQFNPAIQYYADYEDYEFVVKTNTFDPSKYSPNVIVISELEFWQSVIYALHDPILFLPEYYFRLTPTKKYREKLLIINDYFDPTCSVSSDINRLIKNSEHHYQKSSGKLKDFNIQVIKIDFNNCLIAWYYRNDDGPLIIKNLKPMCFNTKKDYIDFMSCDHHYQPFITQLSPNFHI